MSLCQPLLHRLLQAFQAKEMEIVKREDSFIDNSLFTIVLEDDSNGETEEMNLQLGLRKQGMGGKTTIVVGTPIITIEY